MTRFRSSWLRLLVIGLVTCWVTSTHLWMPLWGIDAAVAIFAPFCVLAQLQTIPADRRAQYNRGHSGSSRFVDRAPENPRKKLQSLLEKSGAAAPSPSGACIAASGDPKRCEQDEEDEDDASPPVLSNEDSLVGATKRKDRAAAMKPVAESEDANSKVLKRPLSNSQQQQQQASPSAIISDIPCQSCLATTQDEPQSLLSLAQYGYWSHNLMIALGCSCMLITSENRLDPYAYALYSASADALQLMNQFASVIKAAPSVAPTSLRFASWEIVGPFFSAKSFFPVDPFVSYVRRFASRSDREELRGARRDGAGGSFDIAAEILRLPSSIRAPSAVSDAGFVSWTRIGAVEPSGVVSRLSFQLIVSHCINCFHSCRLPPGFRYEFTNVYLRALHQTQIAKPSSWAGPGRSVTSTRAPTSLRAQGHLQCICAAETLLTRSHLFPGMARSGLSHQST
jgi:hypothetical protein